MSRVDTYSGNRLIDFDPVRDSDKELEPIAGLFRSFLQITTEISDEDLRNPALRIEDDWEDMERPSADVLGRD